MLIAQALAEYGALAAVVEAFHHTWTAAGDYARGIRGTTWAVTLFVCFLVWYVISRRR
jgi:hypothetical protein